jgi:hypothetical protein
MDLLHEREFVNTGAAAPEGGLHGRLDGGRHAVVMVVSWSHEGGEE